MINRKKRYYKCFYAVFLVSSSTKKLKTYNKVTKKRNKTDNRIESSSYEESNEDNLTLSELPLKSLEEVLQFEKRIISDVAAKKSFVSIKDLDICHS